MHASNLQKPLVLLALTAACLAPMQASALVGGAGIDPNSGVSPWNGVGSLDVGGSFFTATLIAPGYVLTAAHVVQGAAASNISFQINGGTSYSVGASNVFVNPDYTGTTTGNLQGDPTNHNDLAIIQLAGSVGSDIPTYSLYNGPMGGQDLNFVSYANSSSVKKTGENIVNVVLPSAGNANQNYVFTYDAPGTGDSLGLGREAGLEHGDSGSAAFVNVNGQWQLAGINTFEVFYQNGPTSGYGTGGGGVAVGSYASWINSVIATQAAPLTPIPEPQNWPLLVAGLAVLGFTVRRKKVLSPAG